MANALTPSPSPRGRGESAAFAEVVHDGAKEANPHGVGQERNGLLGANQQFGIQRVKGVDFYPQRAARRAQALTKVRRLDRVRHEDDDRRKRLLRQQLSNALDEALGLAVPSGGEEEAGHKESGLPVFHLQARHTPKFGRVVRNQRDVICQRDGSNQ